MTVLLNRKPALRTRWLKRCVAWNCFAALREASTALRLRLTISRSSASAFNSASAGLATRSANGHVGALSLKGTHGMRGIANQADPPVAHACGRLFVIVATRDDRGWVNPNGNRRNWCMPGLCCLLQTSQQSRRRVRAECIFSDMNGVREVNAVCFAIAEDR